LGGLSLSDIRAVLMEHVSKYEMEQTYVDEVLRISEGNPLYLKLLCRGLEQNIYKLNQISTLPKGMDDLYQASLFRLEKQNSGSINFLLYLAAAKDFVSAELAAGWMGIDTSSLKNNLLFPCLEFLYENPLTESVEDYQLFHESLREYLTKTYTIELQSCKEQICDWSLQWQYENGDVRYLGNMLSYAMHFSTEHLFESYSHHFATNRIAATSNRRNQLFDLTRNEIWRKLNFEICGNGEAIAKSYYFLQRILAIEDSDGKSFDDFINFTISRHSEPMRMYLLQREILIKPAKREELSSLFERIPSLAKMGERDDDKVLLALLPLWSNELQESLPSVLNERIDDWLDNTRNLTVKKLWQLTKQKRIK
jgi:hypothetical protein